MKNGAVARRLALSVSLLCVGLPSACTAKEKERKAQPSSVKTMLETLQKIDQSDALSVGQISKLLQVPLQVVPGESDQYIAVFHGQGGAWKEVEFRTPPHGDGKAFVLILHPSTPVPMKEVSELFGKEVSLDPPNPRAPADAALTGYVYKRKQGTLRFAFPGFQDFNARIILFDRMG